MCADRKTRDIIYYLNEYPEFFYGGYLSTKKDGYNYGGGIKVKEVGIHINNSNSSRVTYHYEEGVTSNIPDGLLPAKFSEQSIPITDSGRKRDIMLSAYSFYEDVIRNSREIPAPGVLYGKVSTQGYVNGKKLPTYETYEFETFKAGMVDFHTHYEDEEFVYENHWYHDNKRIRNQRVKLLSKKDYTSRVGSLNRISVFNSDDHSILHETINHYLHDELDYPEDATSEEYFNVNNVNYENLLENRFNKQGLVEEAFADSRLVKKDGYFDHLGIVSKNEYFPSVKLGTTTINHKTGITQETRNLAFDYYSGQVTESYHKDGYGNRIATKTTPAYRIYHSMRSRNMLTQESIKYTFTLKDSFDPDNYAYDYTDQRGSLRRQAVGLVSGSFQSWNTGVDIMEDDTRHTTSPVYRKHKYYTLKRPKNSRDGIRQFHDDGTFNIEMANGFIPTFEVNTNFPTNGWELESQITLYDIHSHALEAKDVNNNYAATRYDKDNARVIATVANARYEDFNFFSFDHIESDFIHSGEGAAPYTEDESFKVYPRNKGSYIFSIWVHEDHAEDFRLGLKNTRLQFSDEVKPYQKAGDWYLVREKISITDPSKGVEVICKNLGGYELTVDDLRFHPIDATMTSYVYNEWGELTDILDANNLYTHYEYDAMGRLKLVERETLSDGPVKISDAKIYYSKGRTDASMYGRIVSETKTNNRTYLSINFTNEGSGDYTYRWEIEDRLLSHTTKDDRTSISTSTSFRGDKDVKVTVTDNVTGLKFQAFQPDVNFKYCTPRGWHGDAYCKTVQNSNTHQLCFNGQTVRLYYPGNCQAPEEKPYSDPSKNCPNNCNDCLPGLECFLNFGHQP